MGAVERFRRTSVGTEAIIGHAAAGLHRAHDVDPLPTSLLWNRQRAASTLDEGVAAQLPRMVKTTRVKANRFSPYDDFQTGVIFLVASPAYQYLFCATFWRNRWVPF